MEQRRDGGKTGKAREEEEQEFQHIQVDPTKALNCCHNGKINFCTCYHKLKPYSLAPLRVENSEEVSE